MDRPEDEPRVALNMACYAIGRAARRMPEKPALIVVKDVAAADCPQIWTFAELEAAVLGIAAALAHVGLKRGDRLVIRLGDTSVYPLAFFGAIAGGYVPVPLSPQLTARETHAIAEDSKAAVIVAEDGLPLDVPPDTRILWSAELARLATSANADGYAPVEADDPAFLIYTSGTSGQPKGVLHAHRSAAGRRPMYQGWYGISSADRLLHAGSFNWTFTLGTGLTDPWANGATAIVYTGEKDPALWPPLIDAMKATLFAGVPGVFRQILKYGDAERLQRTALRHGLMAGEAPPADLFETWQRRSGTPLYEALGMSEISTFISTAPDVPKKDGAVGKPQPGRRVAILPALGGAEPLAAGEEGLLAVHRSDPGLMLGYWRESDAEPYRGNWFVSGDLASIDADGYVTHRGRADDVMNAFGYRVAPQEVEAVLAAHPDVEEAACAEIRVRDDVAVIGAFIVARQGASPDPADVCAFAGKRLAAYKCPRQIVVVAALPRTANGKLMRRTLSEKYRAGAFQAAADG